MTIPTHAITGLFIGAITGNPVVGVLAACFPDIDHLYSYVKHGYWKNWNVFYTNAFGRHDVQGDQRNILHNVLIALVLCTIVTIVSREIALTFGLAYASHLLLDALDKSDYYPLYPSKIINLRGFIDFYSWQEGFLFVGMSFLTIIKMI